MSSKDEAAAAAAVASVLDAPDHYAAIDAPNGASMLELRQCYVRASLKVHPDKNRHPQSTQAFQRVAAAWRELGDEQLRRRYDQNLSMGYDPDCMGNDRFENVQAEEAFAAFARAAAACASSGGMGDCADAMFFAQMAQAQAQMHQGGFAMHPAMGCPSSFEMPQNSLQTVGSGLVNSTVLWGAGFAASAVGFRTLGSFMRRVAVIQGFGQVAMGGLIAYQNPEIRTAVETKCTEYRVAERTAPVKAALENAGVAMRHKIQDFSRSEVAEKLGTAFAAVPSCLPRSTHLAASDDSADCPNKAPQIGDRATLEGLSAAAELNGMSCEVVRFDKKKERWVVRILPTRVQVLRFGGQQPNNGTHAQGSTTQNLKLVKAHHLRIDEPIPQDRVPRLASQFI